VIRLPHAVLVVAAALVLACATPRVQPSNAPVDAVVTGVAMGGDLRVVVRCPTRDLHPACLADAMAARQRVEALHGLATDWTPEGEVHRLNAAAGGEPVPISPEVEAMLRASLRLAEATGGAFDPTINALWGLWDFDAGTAPEPEELASRVALVGWQDLAVADGEAALARPGMSVSLGGIAQGWAAAAGRETTEHSVLVDVSGDIAVRGQWTVGVQHPRRPRGELIAAVVLRDAVLTTSGDYERAFELDGERMHHVLDPRTGRPAVGASSATVVSVDGAVADGLATALLVLGPDDAVVRALDAWALVVTRDGVVHELGRRGHQVVAVERIQAEGLGPE
jgi:FAD:protein FMN transferase